MLLCAHSPWHHGTSCPLSWAVLPYLLTLSSAAITGQRRHFAVPLRTGASPDVAPGDQQHWAQLKKVNYLGKYQTEIVLNFVSVLPLAPVKCDDIFFVLAWAASAAACQQPSSLQREVSLLDLHTQTHPTCTHGAQPPACAHL